MLYSLLTLLVHVLTKTMLLWPTFKCFVSNNAHNMSQILNNRSDNKRKRNTIVLFLVGLASVRNVMDAIIIVIKTTAAQRYAM